MLFYHNFFSVTGIKCLQCRSAPDCRNKTECEQSCLKCQRLIACDNVPEQRCLNMSYSHIKNGTTKFVYERKCGFDAWGCQHNCEVPNFFKSKDCEVSVILKLTFVSRFNIKRIQVLFR